MRGRRVRLIETKQQRVIFYIENHFGNIFLHVYYIQICWFVKRSNEKNYGISVAIHIFFVPSYFGPTKWLLQNLITWFYIKVHVGQPLIALICKSVPVFTDLIKILWTNFRYFSVRFCSNNIGKAKVKPLENMLLHLKMNETE